MKSGFSAKNFITLCFRITRKLFNRYVLHNIECFMSHGFDYRLSHPAIFILGAPRSGSTLLYQTLITAFSFGYISNLHCLFFGAPSIAEKLFKTSKKRKESDFRSEYGFTKGLLSPSECGEYWYRFFRKKPAYIPFNEIIISDMLNFRQSLHRLIKVFNKPVLFKNLFATLRLRPIADSIPEALFIVLIRDMKANALSILKARKEVLGCYEKWFSVEVPGYESLLGLPASQQVVEQIKQIHDLIKEVISEGGIDEQRVLYLRYESFCKDVHGQLRRVENFLLSHEVKAKLRVNNIPPEFTVKKTTALPIKLISEVEEYIRRSRKES